MCQKLYVRCLVYNKNLNNIFLSISNKSASRNYIGHIDKSTLHKNYCTYYIEGGL